VAMWKDFPQRLCDALGCRGLVYSRPGYGQSTPRAPEQAWGPDFMHQQAHAVLPALLLALDIDAAHDKPALYGHSDGGSIALLYAAHFPQQVSAVVAAAPHILVEDLSVHSIAKTRLAYLQTDLKKRLARYHADPDSAFWGWNDVWLSPDFKSWSIGAEISSITCPVLAVQGLADEYGTLAQIHGITQRLPHTQLLELADCGHSPHRDQPEVLIAAVQAFFQMQPH
jgi:pimeloyl-ACP methyl ester carboxylesterase